MTNHTAHNLALPTVYEALLAEAATVRASTNTRRMGHTTYVSKAELRRQATALRAMRSFTVRIAGFQPLDPDVVRIVSDAITEAEALAMG